MDKVRLKKLLQNNTSHSLSIETIKNLTGIQPLDFCYLSNPYAVKIFSNWFSDYIGDKSNLNRLISNYPSNLPQIVKNISNKINIEEKNIICGNGSIQIIESICSRLTGKCLIPIPTFSSYYEFLDKCEAIYFQLELNKDFPTEEIIKKIKKEKINNLVLINPNNPDGSIINKESIKNILENTNLDLLIVDESFIDYINVDENICENYSVLDLTFEYSNLFVIRSCSKNYGISGIRCGYGVGDSNYVKVLGKNYLWNINGITEYFFSIWNNPNFNKEYEQARKELVRDRNEFTNSLKNFSKIKNYNSYANFHLIDLRNVSSKDLFLSLLLEGYYVRECSNKIGLKGNFIRIATNDKEKNNSFLNKFSNILYGMSS